MTTNVLIVIPSQVDENGIPRKQLVDIHGTPMAVHTWRRAIDSGIGCTIVDVVDDDVQAALGEAGAYTYRTDPDMHLKTHNYRTESGADRVAATVNRFDRFYTHDVIINLHDDYPALDPKYIRALMYPLASREVDIATMVCPLEDGDENDRSIVKVEVEWNERWKVYVLEGSKVGRATNFSREPISMAKSDTDRTVEPGETKTVRYRHIPIYAYRRVSLDRFVNTPPSDRELEENLEPMRALENGQRVDVCFVPNPPLAVDWEHEIDEARELLDTTLK